MAKKRKTRDFFRCARVTVYILTINFFGRSHLQLICMNTLRRRSFPGNSDISGNQNGEKYFLDTRRRGSLPIYEKEPATQRTSCDFSARRKYENSRCWKTLNVVRMLLRQFNLLLCFTRTHSFWNTRAEASFPEIPASNQFTRRNKLTNDKEEICWPKTIPIHLVNSIQFSNYTKIIFD